MKYAAAILFFLLLRLNGMAQNADGTYPVKDRLYAEIVSHPRIEFKYVGCLGMRSKFYPKVDSFFKLSAPTACIGYFDDASYVLKYYSYFRILFVVQEDSIAWSKLKSSIRDNTHIDIDELYGAAYFNEMLIIDYYKYLRCRYIYGGWGTVNGITYHFDRPEKRKGFKANRKLFKKKKNELWALLAENGMDADALLKSH